MIERPSTTRPVLADATAGSPAWLETDELWARRDSPQASEELVHRFLPLARRLASRYRSAHEPFEDLVQVASLGLLGAIGRFDPDRGRPFEAFAIPTILGELKRHFRKTAWAVHVPRGAQEMAARVDRATREMTARTGRAPRIQALAEHLEASVEDVLVGLEAGAVHFAASLDTPATDTNGDETHTLTDRLGGEDERIGLVETALSLSAAIRQLPYLERQAITMRFEQGMKQADIARRMGCSQMQVSRLLRRASTRLRGLTDPELPDDAQRAPVAPG